LDWKKCIGESTHLTISWRNLNRKSSL